MALFNAAAVCGRTAIFASGSEPSMLTVKKSTALRLTLKFLGSNVISAYQPISYEDD